MQRTVLIGTDGHVLTWTQAVVAAFFAGAAIRIAAGSLRIRLDAPAILMAAVVSLYGLSIAVADDRGLWAAETYRWAIAGLFLIVARSYFDVRSDLRIAVALAAGAIAALCWATVQVVSEEGPASFVRSGLMRASGGFGEPNPYAAFIWAVTLPLIALAVAGRGMARWLRWTSAAGSALGLAALLMTQSRGGILGIAAGLCVILGWLLLRLGPRRKLSWPWRRCSDVGAAIVILFAVATPWHEIAFGNHSGKLGRPGANRALGCRRTHGRVASGDRRRRGRVLGELSGRHRLLAISDLTWARPQCILAGGRRGWTAGNARVRLSAGSYPRITDPADCGQLMGTGWHSASRR